MKGETVVVVRQVEGGADAHGNPITTTTEETVHDVLVAPGPRADLDDNHRPEGTVVAWNLHWPKTFTGSLLGASVKVRGGAPCPIIGDPQPFTNANTPTRWNRPSEAERVDG